MKMKLYEFGPTRSIRVRWTLQELGVEFESIPINLLAGEHLQPKFLKINPAGKIPVLVDDDLILTESVAIVLYLADKYSNKGLIPTNLRSEPRLTAGSCLRRRSWSSRSGASLATRCSIQKTNACRRT